MTKLLATKDTSLIARDVSDRFSICFSSCVIVLVTDGKGKVVLLRQSYISNEYYNLVSGYIKPKERAEDTAYREVEEEVGLKLKSLDFAFTRWFDKKDMLMLGFIGTTDDVELSLSGEVDSAIWIDAQTALSMVHPKGSVSYELVERLLSLKSV